jgi:natural product precursor
MKKVKFEGKLSLNKQTVAKLNQNQMTRVKGGGFSDGCTDGCTTDTSFRTAWNCSDGNCTANCNDASRSCGSCRTCEANAM